MTSVTSTHDIRSLVARVITAPSGGIHSAHDRTIRLAVLLINNADSDEVYPIARWLRENGHSDGIAAYLQRQFTGSIVSFTVAQQYRLEYALRVLEGRIE